MQSIYTLTARDVEKLMEEYRFGYQELQEIMSITQKREGEIEALKNYKMLSFLGAGGFGFVLKGMNLTTYETVHHSFHFIFDLNR